MAPQNCAQELELWVGEWEKVVEEHELKTIFCWKINAARVVIPWSMKISYMQFLNHLAPYMARNGLIPLAHGP
jgi:hypothetical protein